MHMRVTEPLYAKVKKEKQPPTNFEYFHMFYEDLKLCLL